ncbi:trimethylamine methyltransferase family protein [Candidatus Bipolaricaulota bacterium]|nr:trimethylamine methyltransferase family protein [Candidatus Bipolaricaulota bacterium]
MESSFESIRPQMSLLSGSAIEEIKNEAFELLKKVGIKVGCEEGLDLLARGGAKVDSSNNRVYIPETLIKESLNSCPSEIKLFNREGDEEVVLGGKEVNFVPGSSAPLIREGSGTIREATTEDYLEFTRITDNLDNLDLQSTALIPGDVPDELADKYRLFIALINCSKPIMTGTFNSGSFEVMKDMLAVIRGGEEKLKEKPLAMFDCCPTSPLNWDERPCQDLISAARSMVPAEIISMPMLGVSAPITLTGGLVQHTAETLSGIVLHQMANSGAPVIYGGASAVFDMQTSATPMSDIGAMMMNSGYCEMGKSFDLPTQGFMGLSDANTLDSQSGFESGVGMVLAGLSGLNVVAGAGMLDFAKCHSKEKLVIDDEICGAISHFINGIHSRGVPMSKDLYGDIDRSDYFLTSSTTLEWFKREHYFPGQVISRKDEQTWEDEGASTTEVRAREEVEKLLSGYEPSLPGDIVERLSTIMTEQAKKCGETKLPYTG